MNRVGSILLNMGVCDRARAGADGPDRSPITYRGTCVKHVSRELGILGTRLKRADGGRSLYPDRGVISVADLKAHALMVGDIMRSALPHTANFLQTDFDLAIRSVGWSKKQVASLSGEGAFAKLLYAAMRGAVAKRDVYFREVLGCRYRGIPGAVIEELVFLNFN